MQNSTIFGTITRYEEICVPGKQQVILTMDTSWSLNYTITIDGEEALDEFMETCGVETLHALKGLRFSIEIAAVIDEETGQPTGFGPVDMYVLNDDAPLCAVERWKKDESYVRYQLNRA